MTVPEENYSGTVNTVKKENPATLSYPSMHPSFLDRERSMAMWQLNGTRPSSQSSTNNFNGPALVVVPILLTTTGGATCRTRAEPFRAHRTAVPPPVT